MAEFKDLHPTEQALVTAVLAELHRGQNMLAGKLPKTATESMKKAILAQNVLRTCMEAVIKDLIPFHSTFLMDLALRLASYAVSAAPLDQQDNMITQVILNLPTAHAARIRQGVMILTEWKPDDE